MIAKSMSHVQKFVDTHMPEMGVLGDWPQDQIDRLVLPTSGGMDEDLVEVVSDVQVDSDMIDEINL